MAKRVRAFFAIQPDEEGIEFLNSRIQLFRGRGWERYARFIEAADLHITMRFLGELEPDTLESLREKARELAAAGAPFEYEIGRSVLFPRVSRARIIAAEVTAPDEMKALARGLEELAVAAGLEPENRGFKAHITLARLKQGENRPNLPSRPGISRQRAFELLLLESTVGAEGAKYTVIDTFSLGEGEQAGGEEE